MLYRIDFSSRKEVIRGHFDDDQKLYLQVKFDKNRINRFFNVEPADCSLKFFAKCRNNFVINSELLELKNKFFISKPFEINKDFEYDLFEIWFEVNYKNMRFFDSNFGTNYKLRIFETKNKFSISQDCTFYFDNEFKIYKCYVDVLDPTADNLPGYELLIDNNHVLNEE